MTQRDAVAAATKPFSLIRSQGCFRDGTSDAAFTKEPSTSLTRRNQASHKVHTNSMTEFRATLPPEHSENCTGINYRIVSYSSDAMRPLKALCIIDIEEELGFRKYSRARTLGLPFARVGTWRSLTDASS
jgi:hypothetical protein